ncbi:transporter substrate-binding domain-containing protein [Silvanigrella sp.]|jgi:polar amino acid transport system substrate-binding protein|uniref:transporter substrate-binding domain-containing protein n=1 Tax=Silvanigrella sp. TaxID=2024976 RepID=UPI0037C54D66
MKTGYLKFILRTFSLLSVIPAVNLYAVAPGQEEAKKEDLSLQRVKNEKSLKVCSDAGFLPFEMKTQKGEWMGFDIDMMKEFSKSLSVGLKMVQISFDGIIPALISGKCDMIAAGMTVTPERKVMVLFSDSTFTSGLSIAVKNNEKNKLEFKDLSSLDKKGLKIAVKTGYTSDIYLSKTLKNAQILKFDQDSDLVLAVMQGRANAFVSDSTYVDLMDKGNKNKFIILPTKIISDSFSVAGRKDDYELMKSFNVFLKQWRENGGYNKSKKFYFEDQVWRSQVAN